MSKPSLHAATRMYLEHLCANYGAGTRKAYASIVNRLCRRFPGAQFCGVTTGNLFAFLYGPGGISVGVAPNTASLHRAALKSFFEYGSMLGWRRDMIAIPKQRTQRTTRPSGQRTRLTADELVLMLHKAEHPMLRAMLAVAMNTGLRVSDVQKIRIGDVQWETGGIVVVMQKTGLVDVLPVTLDLDDELRRYLLWLTATTGSTLRDVDRFLFPGFQRGGFHHEHDPHRHVSYDWAAKRLGELYAACGVHVEAREMWHTIRRSVARIYFDAMRGEMSHDHALRQTAALLGHKHATQTETYLGLDAERVARDESLRGKRLLIPGGNVTPLHQANAS